MAGKTSMDLHVRPIAPFVVFKVRDQVLYCDENYNRLVVCDRENHFEIRMNKNSATRILLRPCPLAKHWGIVDASEGLDHEPEQV